MLSLGERFGLGSQTTNCEVADAGFEVKITDLHINVSLSPDEILCEDPLVDTIL